MRNRSNKITISPGTEARPYSHIQTTIASKGVNRNSVYSTDSNI